MKKTKYILNYDTLYKSKILIYYIVWSLHWTSFPKYTQMESFYIVTELFGEILNIDFLYKLYIQVEVVKSQKKYVCITVENNNFLF